MLNRIRPIQYTDHILVTVEGSQEAIDALGGRTGATFRASTKSPFCENGYYYAFRGGQRYEELRRQLFAGGAAPHPQVVVPLFGIGDASFASVRDKIYQAADKAGRLLQQKLILARQDLGEGWQVLWLADPALCEGFEGYLQFRVCAKLLGGKQLYHNNSWKKKAGAGLVQAWQKTQKITSAQWQQWYKTMWADLCQALPELADSVESNPLSLPDQGWHTDLRCHRSDGRLRVGGGQMLGIPSEILKTGPAMQPAKPVDVALIVPHKQPNLPDFSFVERRVHDMLVHLVPGSSLTTLPLDPELAGEYVRDFDAALLLSPPRGFLDRQDPLEQAGKRMYFAFVDADKPVQTLGWDHLEGADRRFVVDNVLTELLYACGMVPWVPKPARSMTRDTLYIGIDQAESPDGVRQSAVALDPWGRLRAWAQQLLPLKGEQKTVTDTLRLMARVVAEAEDSLGHYVNRLVIHNDGVAALSLPQVVAKMPELGLDVTLLEVRKSGSLPLWQVENRDLAASRDLMLWHEDKGLAFVNTTLVPFEEGVGFVQPDTLQLRRLAGTQPMDDLTEQVILLAMACPNSMHRSERLPLTIKLADHLAGKRLTRPDRTEIFGSVKPGEAIAWY